MIVFLLSSLLWAQTPSDSDIVGTWKYVGFTYGGQSYPPTDPTLDLRFTFKTDHTSNLKWIHTDENGYCQRTAIYEIRAEGWLYQKVTWVDPKNEMSCSRDPDMRLGNETFTHLTLNGQFLNLDLELNGQPFIYSLSKVSDK